MRTGAGLLLWATAAGFLLRRMLRTKRWDRPPVWELGTLVLLTALPYGWATVCSIWQDRAERLTAAALWTAVAIGFALWVCRRYLAWRWENWRKDEKMEAQQVFPAMERARTFCRDYHMLPPPGGVMLCAVSGGRDSMALLHFLKDLSLTEGFSLRAAHYNHHLRPTAERDEALVRRYCRYREIPLTCGGGDVSAWARENGASLEDAARTLRYRFLEETADQVGAVRIATAHNVQDNAETVLLHLLRGSGLRGLGGIPPVRGKIVRPFLETDRRDIDDYVARKGIPYGEDETNADTTYTRNRLRLEILPRLEEIAPGCTARIAGAAGILRVDEEHLDEECTALLPAPERDRVTLPVNTLMGKDLAVRRRLVRGMARQLGVELTAAQTDGVLALGSSGAMNLPGGIQAFRQAHRLTIRRLPPAPAPLVLHLGEQSWGGRTLRVRESDGGEMPPRDTAAVLSAREITGALTIAAWDGTGRMSVENGSRSIKRIFADQGISADRREEHPALYLDGRPVAVLGVAVDWFFQPKPGERTLTVVWEKEEKGRELL